MRFAVLGSGSRGNAVLVEAGGARVLVDCGFAVQELTRRLDALAVDPATLDAVLVTHEHGDHVRGVPPLVRRYRVPVWMTAGTCAAAGCGDLEGLHLFNCHEGPFRIGGLRVEPFAVPHDAREPSQFAFEADGLRLGQLTDTGGLTPHILERLAECDALILECNHDAAMLAAGPYPPMLRERVGGAYGHLSNRQAADLLTRIDRGRLRHLVAGHLSEKNNRPELAREALLGVDETLGPRLTVAAQDQGSGWLAL